MNIEKRIRNQMGADANVFQRRRPMPESHMPAAVSRRIRGRQGLNVVFALIVTASLGAGGLWAVDELSSLRESVRPAGAGLEGSNTIAVPPPGETQALFLEDGHPVFAVSHADGSLTVVDALSTHAPYGINKLIWWCPSSRFLEDPFHGSKYDERGRYADGPAPGGLSTYETSRTPDDAGHVTVGDRLPAPGRIPAADGPSGPSCIQSDGTVRHEVTSKDFTTPEDLDEGPDGWTAVVASLNVHGPAASLCEAPDACVDVPPVNDPRDFTWRIRNAVWLVRISDGKVAELARLTPSGS